MSELTDKVAVVTGAATGIGETIARRLAAAGARVAVVGHDRDGLARLARELGDGDGRALALEVDVRDHAAMARAIERIVGTLGGLHLAVNG